MSDATRQPAAGLEDLLERRLPSAVDRHDAALAEAGIPNAEVAGTKAAVTALAIHAVKAESPSSSLRDRVLASGGRSGKYGIFADRVARLFDLPVADAEALLVSLEKPEAWNRFLVDGLEMIPVMGGPKCEGAITTFVRIQPGTHFPHHAHRGDETMLVLDGGFTEVGISNGEEAWRGDEVFRTDGTEHTLAGLPGVPCVAAVVIHGTADFR